MCVSSCCCLFLLLQVISMAADKVIKIWDLRNHRCIQTITDTDWPTPEDNKPYSLIYDSSRSRMVTAAHCPVVWHHMCVSDDVSGHKHPLVAALYNNFFQVVRMPHASVACIHGCSIAAS
jgi:hypothetical protein